MTPQQMPITTLKAPVVTIVMLSAALCCRAMQSTSHARTFHALPWLHSKPHSFINPSTGRMSPCTGAAVR